MPLPPAVSIASMEGDLVLENFWRQGAGFLRLSRPVKVEGLFQGKPGHLRLENAVKRPWFPLGGEQTASTGGGRTLQSLWRPYERSRRTGDTKRPPSGGPEPPNKANRSFESCARREEDRRCRNKCERSLQRGVVSKGSETKAQRRGRREHESGL